MRTSLAASQSEPKTASTLNGESPPSVDELEYLDERDSFIIGIDIGNTGTSVTLAHLTWASQPLSSSSPALRTVLTYPYSTPILAPVPSRTPSLVYYDREDRARAFGAECVTETAKRRAHDEGWVLVKSWKEQTKLGAQASVSTPEQALDDSTSRKLFKKNKPAPAPNPVASGLLTSPTPSTLAATRSMASLAASHASLSSEGLLDALDARGAAPVPRTPSSREHEQTARPHSIHVVGIDGGSGALGDLGRRSKDKKPSSSSSASSGSTSKHYPGPRLRDIYADFLRWLVAAARAWYAETTPNGDETFLRLWERCIFVVAIPADWGTSETEMLRGAVEEARLLPAHFEVGRLIFVKEPAAITYFARAHTQKAEEWLREGGAFALCDAAEQGVSIIGYTVAAVSPRLKLRAYETVTRLPSGSGAVLATFSDLLTSRLSRTKFKSSAIHAHLMDEFRGKVLPRFAGVTSLEGQTYRLRLFAEGKGDFKLDKAADSNARVKDGWMTLSGEDVESCFKPAVDSIIVRLSSVLPRGGAAHILLSGGFAEAPYLVRRLRETFTPLGVRLVVPNIPTHSAVSEGALRFYLSETLRPRRTRYALGVQVAVDWSTSWTKGMQNRDVYIGSGGQKLVVGKFGEVVPKGALISSARSYRKTFNFRYRLAAQDPTFRTTLWRFDADHPEQETDGWMVGIDGQVRPAFEQVCDIEANLQPLIETSPALGSGEKAYVQLEVELVVHVGAETLKATVEWREGKEVRSGPPSKISEDAY
ncbi:Hsp70 family protein [Rhodotorula paludigena]|uniref:Hsp70 family protein n=1 Tax=Rhodotorula paludigena TaxID=86838 RepID=UPI003177B66C